MQPAKVYLVRPK